MAAPSAPTMLIIGSHKWGEDATAQVETPTSDAVTSVTAVISQTQGGAAIETVTTSTKAASYPRMEYWYLSWPTDSIASSPYYITLYATNSDGDGTPAEISTYLYFPPTVSITSPANGSTVTDSSVTLAWTATDDYGISWQRASVTHDGTELWGAEVEGNSIAVPSSVVFEDGESYSFSVMARNGKGMESTATNTASFSFVAPSVPALVIAEGDGKSASITVTDSSYTESGTVLEASSSMMESLTIHGKSVQDGTPTPSAPVAIESVQSTNRISPTPWRIGANYYGISTGATLNTTSDGGVTVTQNQDGTITLSVTTANRGAVFLSDLLPAGTCFRNVGELAGGDSTTRLSFYRLDKDMKVVAGYNVSNGAALSNWPSGSSTLTEDGYFALALGSTTAGKTLTVSRMFVAEVGDMNPPFDQYGSISIASHGKNLFDTGSLNVLGNATGGKSVASDGTISANDTANDGRANNSVNNSDYICWLDAGTYTLSVDVIATSSNAYNAFVVRKVSDDTALVYRLGAATFASSFTDTFTVSERTQVYFVFKTYTASIRIQLERGSTATAYEPYSSTTTPVPVTLRSLPDGTRDEWISGETADTLIQRVGAVTLLSSDWVASGSQYRKLLTDYAEANQGSNIRSTAYAVAASTSGLAANTVAITANGAYVYLGASSTLVDSEFVYKLATPVTTTLPHVNLPYVDGSAWVDAEVTPQIEATFRPVDFPDQPAADSVDVVRVNADGSTWTVASGLSVGDTAIDPLPPLGVDAVYKAVGRTSAGGMSEKLYMHGIPTTGWVLNFGDAAQEHVALIYNPQVTMSLDQGGESYHFADGGLGGGLPVFYPTTDRDMSGTMKFDTVMYGDADVVLDLCNRYPVAWLRDPYGHRWMARVNPSFSHDYGGAWPVSLSWSAVRFKEV